MSGPRFRQDSLLKRREGVWGAPVGREGYTTNEKGGKRDKWACETEIRERRGRGVAGGRSRGSWQGVVGKYKSRTSSITRRKFVSEWQRKTEWPEKRPLS